MSSLYRPWITPCLLLRKGARHCRLSSRFKCSFRDRYESFYRGIELYLVWGRNLYGYVDFEV
jgi:hypothetical protein